MSLLELFSGTRPGANTGTSQDPLRPAPGAARFLQTRDVDPRRESTRVTIGFIALAAMSATLLNIGIYQSESQREIKERWTEVEDNTTDKVSELRSALAQFTQDAELVATMSRAPGGRLLPAASVAGVLERGANTLRWSDIELRGPDGELLARARPNQARMPAPPAEIAMRAGRLRRTTLGVIGGDADRPSMLVAAVPLRSGPTVTGTLVAYANAEDALRPLMSSWPGFGKSAGAYLAGREGDDIVVLSSPPAGFGITAGARSTQGAGAFRGAALAASGAESRVEILAGTAGGSLWAVTRFIPELNCGLVAQVRPEELESGSSNVLAGLIALDVAMVLMVAAAVTFWRRQYETGLSRRELEVTKRHANQIQAVFDNAFDAILTFDRHGTIRTANPAAEKIFQRPCDELRGLPLAKIVRSEDDRGHFLLPAPGRVIRTEALYRGGLGAPIELSIACAGEGDDLIYTAIARDISHQAQAEEQVRSFAHGLEVSNRRLAEVNAQLEEASRLKSEFLANTSHELRTPLNGMIGFLQLVLDGMCSSPEEEREFMQQALGCSRHLLGLINDVLDIAKIESGKLTLDIEEVGVRKLFDEVYTVTHVQAAQKGIQLAFETPPAHVAGVRGDFRKIKQVLINLVGNSIKFTPSGSVTVRATEHAGLGHWMIEVVDTGIGIPADRQERIFEKFMQADGSTTRMYGGTGLGLAISRSLIELMGGIIGVHSEGEGRGTRMYFSLPRWHEEIDDLPEAPSPECIEGPAGGPLVLLVEDDPIFRRYLVTLLHHQGYRTVETRHADGGWMLARRLRPATVVLDYALSCPEGAALRTGWDLAERMAADATTRHIPLIFVTGFEDEVRERLRSTTFARQPQHLAKPIEGTALMMRIEEMLGLISDRVVRILMADDDPSVVAYVRKVLPEERFHIDVANNGEECLHILRVQPRGFDLLMLDLMMPSVSGYDVLRELSLSGVHRDLPVLVLTNFPEARDAAERRMLEQGLVLDVLPKSSVHDNPLILPHIIDWHMQVKGEIAEHPAAGLMDGDALREEAA